MASRLESQADRVRRSVDGSLAGLANTSAPAQVSTVETVTQTGARTIRTEGTAFRPKGKTTSVVSAPGVTSNVPGSRRR